MFSLGVLETDAFLDMPLSAQALYFHLSLRADDDGFIGNPKRITQNIGASLDDLRILIAKRFVLTFEDGVIVIKHWRMHNTIKKDRYTATNYSEDLKLLHIKENGAYTFREDCGAQLENKWSADGAQMEHLSSTGLGIGIDKDKVSIDKVSKGGAGGTRTTTPKKKKTSVDLFNELENGRLSPVFDTVLKWMQYKDESGKPYKTETGMKSFITQVEKHLHEYGAAAVADCIELSMSNNYQGVVWDRLKKQTASNSDSNPFLRMLQESEANDGTGNTEDSISFEGGIPDVLPGFEGW